MDALADRLRLSNRDRERLRALVGLEVPDLAANPRAQRLAMHRLGTDLYRDLVRLALAAGEVDDALAQRLHIMAANWRAPSFPLSGNDLLAQGVPAGPELGRILALLRQEWEEADFALDRETCLRRASELIAATSRHLTP